jgi:predicted dehydrogenase
MGECQGRLLDTILFGHLQKGRSMSQTRRSFLKSSLAAAASVTLAGTKSSGKVLGANDTIRIAVAGLNGRGSSHVDEWLRMKGVEITYLIDPDTRTYDKRLKQIDGKGGKKPKLVKDVREALDDKELDAISIATPNHWHALMTIWGCQAGKDVYVEKPCSHNIHEGRIAVEAAQKYNRIVQHGTQSRSGGFAQVVEVVKSGQLGKLLVSRGLCYKGGAGEGGLTTRGSIGFAKPSDPPAVLDFNLWLGPAPQQAYHANLVPYRWHWFWDFGNGDIGNQGVHEMDKARWAIPGATLPRSVLSLGGRLGYTDQGQTPSSQIALFDYGDTQLIFEVRGLKSKSYQGEHIGNILHLEGGTIVGTKFYPKGSDKAAPLPKVETTAKRRPGGGHFGNFIEAVRSRKTGDLNAPILEGHLSAALCHLANMSYRLGEEVPFNPQTKAFGDNKEAYETLARMEEYLKENKVNLEATKYRLGRKLTIDAGSETIAGDAEANKLLTRDYRKPFVVPEKMV